VRKIKNFVGGLLSITVVILILCLIFIPLQYFGHYAYLIFLFFLIIIPFYILAEIYYFVKDTPKRRSSRIQEKNKKRKIVTALEWTGMGIFVIILLLARNGSIFKQDCPSIIQGNEKAELKIKYFFNVFCPTCWNQEKSLRRAMEKYGDDMQLERYDVRYCKAEWNREDMKSIPAFKFDYKNETERSGSLSQEELYKIICDKIQC